MLKGRDRDGAVSGGEIFPGAAVKAAAALAAAAGQRVPIITLSCLDLEWLSGSGCEVGYDDDNDDVEAITSFFFFVFRFFFPVFFFFFFSFLFHFVRVILFREVRKSSREKNYDCLA